MAWSDEDLGVLILIRMRAEASEMGNIAKLQKIAHEMKKKEKGEMPKPPNKKEPGSRIRKRDRKYERAWKSPDR